MSTSAGPWKAVDFLARAEVIQDARGRDLVMRQDGATLDDMRVMAASIELLEALEACLVFVDIHRRRSGGDGDLSAKVARDAIAKARGRA